MSSAAPFEEFAADAASRPRLRLVAAPPARTESSWVPNDEQPIGLKLDFRELVLIHRSLEAVRTLGLAEHQDDLLAETLQLVDVALEGAV
jgi:hypothetical protein